VPLAAIRRVYAHDPLDATTVAALNAARHVDELRGLAEEIGYPLR
jgi:hypothetical protein